MAAKLDLNDEQSKKRLLCLKSIALNVFSESQFHLKAFRADCALLYIDALKRHLAEAGTKEQAIRAWNLASELNAEISSRRKTLLRYFTCRGQDDEQGLIDLMVATELVTYALEALAVHEIATDEPPPERQELASNVEELVAGMNSLTLESDYLDHNKLVAKFISHRSVIDSTENLLESAVSNFKTLKGINACQAVDVFHLIERLLARVISLPVTTYNNLASSLLMAIIAKTPTAYHEKLVTLLFSLAENLFDEKKRGVAPQYKSRVLSKVCQMLTIMLYKCGD